MNSDVGRDFDKDGNPKPTATLKPKPVRMKRVAGSGYTPPKKKRRRKSKGNQN